MDVIIENLITNITELSSSPQISNPKTPPTSKSWHPFLDPRPIDDTTFDELLQTLDSTRGIGLTMRKAIDGNALSQADIGAIYNYFHYNYEKAMKWYLKSAALGNDIALFSIGCIYYNANGSFRRDFKTAREYFAKASELNYAPAQNMIGFIYEWGLESPRSHKDALLWYLKADKLGCPFAPYNIALLIQKRVLHPIVHLDMNDIEFLLKAANRGNTDAQHYLGYFYSLGRYVGARSNTKAVEWCNLAAYQGNMKAMLFLGGLYSTLNNTKLSMKWLLIAANSGSSLAQNRLGHRYFTGTGVPMNRQAGIKWHHLAAKSGSFESIRILVAAYKLGQGVSVDIPIAKELNGKLPYAIYPKYINNEYSKLKRIEKKRLIH